MSESSEFVPNAYAVTGTGRLMPGQVVRLAEARTGSDAGGFLNVRTASGNVYTFPANRVMSVDDAEQLLREQRIARVRETYTWTVESTRSRLVVRCVNPAHPVRSNYVLVQAGSRMRCNCPAALDNPSQPCKHESAWRQLQERRAAIAAAPPTPAAPAAQVVEVAAEDW